MAKRTDKCSECGAPKSAHPNHDRYPCLDALKAVVVNVPCAWPGCEKKSRKTGLGKTLCNKHRKAEWDAFMTINCIEGPATLMRPTPTIEECEYMHRTGEMPPSRLAPVALKDSRIHCSECDGPLLILNPPDWKAGDPDVVNHKPVHIAICPKCSFQKQAVA